MIKRELRQYESNPTGLYVPFPGIRRSSGKNLLSFSDFLFVCHLTISLKVSAAYFVVWHFRLAEERDQWSGTQPNLESRHIFRSKLRDLARG